jgi:hypothetical protein
MGELNYVQKTTTKVNNMYTFVTHDAVSEAIHPLLVKHGIVMLSSVDRWGQDGNRTSADVTVSFVNADNISERIEVKTFGFGIDSQDKGPGKAISYACKYAVLKTFVLETGDDPERDSIDHVGCEAQGLADKAKEALEKGDWAELCALDKQDGWLDAWKLLDSRKRKSIKELMGRRNEYRDALATLAENGDDVGTLEVWNEMSKPEKAEVWRCLQDETREFITKLKEKASE